MGGQTDIWEKILVWGIMGNEGELIGGLNVTLAVSQP